jgi:hypothetical protein
MIPAAFTGGWVRNGIALDGTPPAEDAMVWWLQAPTRHGDLRLKRDSGEAQLCFAGVTSGTEFALTWRHDIELAASDSADVGAVQWDGDDLLESGCFTVDGREVRYVERWQRLPGSESPLHAFSSPTGRIVRAGDYALTIVDARAGGGHFAAIAWRLGEDDGWLPAHRWPIDASLPAPPVALADAERAVLLDDGVEWAIDEVG